LDGGEVVLRKNVFDGFAGVDRKILNEDRIAMLKLIVKIT
jgi:hypothetical protein